MRFILIVGILFGAICSSFGQNYSYSFEGNLTPELQDNLSRDLQLVEGVSSVKFKFKPDSQRGELILFVNVEKERAEEDLSFSPITVKSILLEYGFTPLDFIQLNTQK